MCGRFLLVAFVKLIVTFLNAFALWLKKTKQKKKKKKERGYSHVFKTQL